MRRLFVLLLAAAAMFAASALPAVADDPPSPGFPTGDLWGKYSHHNVRWDVSGETPEVLEFWHGAWRIPYGGGIAFDSEGYFYVTVQTSSDILGLWIYDKDPATWAQDGSWYYEPVGTVSIPEGMTIGTIAMRTVNGTRQVFGYSNPGHLFTFDATDVTNPTLLHYQDLSGMMVGYTGWSRIAFDADGYLWVGGTLNRLELDDDGYVTNHQAWLGIAGYRLAFEPESNRLFGTIRNHDEISVRDRLDPTVELARLTNVCRTSYMYYDPFDIVFSSAGDLYVSCRHGGDDAAIVKFPRHVLADVDGVVDASTLEQARASSPSVYGGGTLAFRPAESPTAYLIDAILDVAALDIPDGIATSFAAKLDTALGILEDDDPTNDGDAVDVLGAFIHSVEAQSGKKISEEDATDLVIKAQRIIDLLSS